MKRYLKQRRGSFLILGGLWGFVNVYLVFLCIPALLGEDILYLNTLIFFFSFFWLLRDFHVWKQREEYFRNPGEFSEEEEEKILGEGLYTYVCQQQQEKEQEVQEYTRRLEELSDYVSRWSHEAKLPLVSLRLMNERNTDTALRKEMQSCIMRLERLLHTVLTGSKLQQPRHDVRMEKFGLQDAVKEAVKNQSYFLIEYQFELELDLQGISVYSDRRWLVYLLDQLLANAVKYRKEKPCLSFHAVKEGREVRLMVEDNGMGISPEDLPYIFEKGYVGKTLRKGDYHSTGMGLAFAKQIAELLCISLEVSSVEGEKTCFFLRFQDNADHLLLP